MASEPGQPKRRPRLWAQLLCLTFSWYPQQRPTSWTLPGVLDSMYSEQDPCGCCEQADIDPGQIQVEAASPQPFNFEGLSNLTRRTQPDTTRLLVGAPLQHIAATAMEQFRDVLRVLMFCKILQACDVRRLKHVRGAAGWRQSWG